MLAADHVAANTFYAVNPRTGLYRWTNCGSTTLINANTGSWLTNASINSQVKDCSRRVRTFVFQRLVPWLEW